MRRGLGLSRGRLPSCLIHGGERTPTECDAEQGRFRDSDRARAAGAARCYSRSIHVKLRVISYPSLHFSSHVVLVYGPISLSAVASPGCRSAAFQMAAAWISASMTIIYEPTRNVERVCSPESAKRDERYLGARRTKLHSSISSSSRKIACRTLVTCTISPAGSSMRVSGRLVCLAARGQCHGSPVFAVIVPVDLQFFGAVEDRIAASSSEILPSPFHEGLDLGARRR